jgi:tetratricopeptide (TPR) repeat protein/DNA-binding CsgD family transcriptional regulator
MQGKEKKTKAQIDALNEEASRLAVEDPSAALPLCRSILRTASRCRYSRGAAMAQLYMGRALWRLGDYSSAFDNYQSALSGARRARAVAVESQCLIGMGVCLDRFGDFDAALQCFERFAQLNPLDKDPRALKLIAANYGRILEQSGRLEEGIAFLKSVLPRLAGHDPTLSVHLELNLGSMLCMLKRQVEGIPHLRRAVELLQGMGDVAQCVLAISNLGEALAHTAETTEAQQQFSHALKLATAHGLIGQQVLTLIRWSDLHVVEGRYDEAVRLTDAALALVPQLTDTADLAELYHKASLAYESAGRHREALSFARVSGQHAVDRLSRLSSERAQRAIERMQLRIKAKGAEAGRAMALLRTPALPPRAAATAAPAAPAMVPVLSQREKVVLGLVAQGYSNPQIGEALQLSPYTARYYVSSLLNKLSASTRGEAVAVAGRYGLL